MSELNKVVEFKGTKEGTDREEEGSKTERKRSKGSGKDRERDCDSQQV